MTKFLAAAFLLSAGLAAPALAANATQPHENCDRRLDNCGPTGNERTDQLNGQQSDNNGQPAAPNAPPAKPQ